VWVLRHAKARVEPRGRGGDHERELARRGEADAAALGERVRSGADGFEMAELDLPELVLCSTATRTVQTLDRVIGGFTGAPPVEYRRSIYAASAEGLLNELRSASDDVGSIMIVGHNPGSAELVVGLLAREDGPGRRRVETKGFPTCAVGVLRVSADRWSSLDWGCATLLGLFVPPF
jgi:phosphohistidine phosphatase